jgi:hypothetical protein
LTSTNTPLLWIFELLTFKPCDYLIFLSYQVTVMCHSHRSRPVTWYITWLLTHLWCQHLCMCLLIKFYSIPFYSLHFYSILFTSILFYSIPFKSNFSIRGISSYSSSSLTSGMPTLNLRVYKASPIVEYSLTLTINIALP